MSSPRPVVVFLMVAAIVLIGVYLLGVGMGSERERRPSMDDLQAFFAGLRLGAPSKVACADLSAQVPGSSNLPRCSCDGMGRIMVLPPGCTAVLGSTLPWRRRTLTLSSPNGGSVKVEVSGDEGRTVVRGDLGQQSDFPVPPGGANLSLACPINPCLAIIQK